MSSRWRRGRRPGGPPRRSPPPRSAPLAPGSRSKASRPRSSHRLLAAGLERGAGCILAGMDVRPALKSDIPDLLPLFRGYCDFYRASPSDDGLIAMGKAMIEGPDSDGMLLVARDGDGASVGFAAVGWKWSSLRGARVAVMEDLFVA